MAEEVKETEVVEEVEQGEVDTQESTEQQREDVKTYTQEELEEIVQQRVAREKKAREKAVEEAEKLAKMNADEKEAYEREQLEKELEEYKRKDQFYSMSCEASKMLAEHDIQADDNLLQIIVKDDAEGTQTAVNAFVELVNAKVEQGVKKALSGRTPKANINSGVLTKEKIMQIEDDTERQKKIRENIQLFQ